MTDDGDGSGDHDDDGRAVDGAMATDGGMDGFRGISDSTHQQQFSAERVADFRRFASAGSAYERLVKSFAPSIGEMDDVKRG